MFRYRLRTLLVLTILGPPALWGAWLLLDSLRPSPPPPEKEIYRGHRFILDVF
jgi:hypothetical protein